MGGRGWGGCTFQAYTTPVDALLPQQQLVRDAAETPFAEAAALKPRDEGSSDTFLSWFNYQRLFQFNTWGHLALIAAFVLFQLVPFIISTVFSIVRAVSGIPVQPTKSPDDTNSKTFQQAIADGDIAVRTFMLLMHWPCTNHLPYSWQLNDVVR